MGVAETRWNTPWGIVLCLLPFVFTVAVYMWAEALGPTLHAAGVSFLEPVYPLWPDVTFTIAITASTLLFFPLVRWRYSWFLTETREVGATRALVAKGATIGAVLGAVGFVLGYVGSGGEFGATGDSESFGQLWVLLGGLYVSSVVGPIAEEGYFRVVVYGFLRKHCSAHVAIAISSVLFTLAHGLDWRLPTSLALGLVTSFVYERTRSFAFCVAVHSATNLASMSIQIVLHNMGVYS